MAQEKQTPLCVVGTEFLAGTVVEIKNDCVIIKTYAGNKPFSFAQVEAFINAARSISQA